MVITSISFQKPVYIKCVVLSLGVYQNNQLLSIQILEKLMSESIGMCESNEEADRMGSGIFCKEIRGSGEKRHLEDGRSRRQICLF